MISENYVRALYQMLLDREPENDDVVKRHAESAEDEVSFLRDVVESEEFQRKKIRSLSVGRHLNHPYSLVETMASSADLQIMLDGIAEKWRKYGRTEPHWSVLTNEIYLQSDLEKHIDGFYASGVEVAGLALAAIRRAGLDPATFRTAADFGCGVGRLTLALARHFGHVTGIDISHGHLRLAQERAAQTGVDNVNFRLMSDADELRSLGKVDFLISLIVLQHNPPPIIAKMLENLLLLLNPGGIAYVQVPTYIEGYSFDVGRYLGSEKFDMEMNALPQKDIFRIIDSGGCIPLEVREDGWTGAETMLSHTFLIQKKPAG